MNSADEPLAGLTFGGNTDPDTQKRALRIGVTNEGKTPIHEIKVEWVYTYEAPQDDTKDFAAQHGAAFKQATGSKPIKAFATGGRYSFNPAKGEAEGPLAPGATRVYLYPPEWMPAMVSLVQSLSPERYHVAITMNGKEEVGIPGNIIGEFIGREFGSGK